MSIRVISRNIAMSIGKTAYKINYTRRLYRFAAKAIQPLGEMLMADYQSGRIINALERKLVLGEIKEIEFFSNTFPLHPQPACIGPDIGTREIVDKTEKTPGRKSFSVTLGRDGKEKLDLSGPVSRENESLYFRNLQTMHAIYRRPISKSFIGPVLIAGGVSGAASILTFMLGSSFPVLAPLSLLVSFGVFLWAMNSVRGVLKNNKNYRKTKNMLANYYYVNNRYLPKDFEKIGPEAYFVLNEMILDKVLNDIVRIFFEAHNDPLGFLMTVETTVEVLKNYNSKMTGLMDALPAVRPDQQPLENRAIEMRPELERTLAVAIQGLGSLVEIGRRAKKDIHSLSQSDVDKVVDVFDCIDPYLATKFAKLVQAAGNC